MCIPKCMLSLLLQLISSLFPVKQFTDSTETGTELENRKWFYKNAVFCNIVCTILMSDLTLATWNKLFIASQWATYKYRKCLKSELLKSELVWNQNFCEFGYQTRLCVWNPNFGFGFRTFHKSVWNPNCLETEQSSVWNPH